MLNRSRVAITALLVAGLFLANTSTALALSGMSSSGSAGTAQYPRGVNTGALPNTIGGSEVKGAEEAVRGVQSVHATRQAEGDGNELPFTGLAAIPLLMLGAGMAVAGFVLRSRGRPADRPRNDH
jgi:hypothetical protein